MAQAIDDLTFTEEQIIEDEVAEVLNVEKNVNLLIDATIGESFITKEGVPWEIISFVATGETFCLWTFTTGVLGSSLTTTLLICLN